MDNKKNKYIKSTIVPPKIRRNDSELKLRRDNEELIRKIERLNNGFFNRKKNRVDK